jgi:hypothetical protein
MHFPPSSSSTTRKPSRSLSPSQLLFFVLQANALFGFDRTLPFFDAGAPFFEAGADCETNLYQTFCPSPPHQLIWNQTTMATLFAQHEKEVVWEMKFKLSGCQSAQQ